MKREKLTQEVSEVLMIFRALTVILWEWMEHEKVKIDPEFIQWLESRRAIYIVFVPAFSYQHARRKGEK